MLATKNSAVFLPHDSLLESQQAAQKTYYCCSSESMSFCALDFALD